MTFCLHGTEYGFKPVFFNEGSIGSWENTLFFFLMDTSYCTIFSVSAGQVEDSSTSTPG